MRTLLLSFAAAACAAAASGGGMAGAADSPSCPTVNPPDSLSLSGGTPQSAKLGAPFDTNLQVTLTASNGCPITTPLAGVAVTFAAPSSGPSGTFAASGSNALLVGTNASGGATAPMFMANTLPGGYLVVASSGYGSVSFSLVNTASGVPARIVPLSPAGESAGVGDPYGQPLQAEVLDANGLPVPGANVTFALGSGAGGAGASFAGGGTQATEPTNLDGVATSPSFTGGSVAGKFTATATTPVITEPVSFPLDNLVGKPPAMAPIGGLHRSATVGSRYGPPLEVKVVDGNGRPLQGETVTFTLGSTGNGAGGQGAASAGASFADGSTQATATTDVDGIAVSPWFEANATAGVFSATAATAGVTDAVRFQLDNLAGKPPSLRAVGSARRSANVGTSYRRPLEVRVLDHHGKPLQGETVTFTLGSAGGGGGGAGGSGTASAGGSFADGSSQVTETTDAAGVAISPRFDANTTAGEFTATAAVPGVTDPVSFELDNLAGKPPSLHLVGAVRRSATVGTSYHRPLGIKVLDAHGRPLQGVTVTFTLGSAGGGAGGAGGSGTPTAGGTFAGGSSQPTETTNAAGVATSPRFAANTSAGEFTGTAAVAGVTNPVSFSLDNLAGKPPTIRVLGAESRSTTAGTGYSRPLEVEVLDGHGKPLQGETVTFTLGSAGGGAGGAGGTGTATAGGTFADGSSEATETTDARGIATSPRFSANSTAGEFTATAAVPGVIDPVSFSLDNLAARPPVITPIGGLRSSAAVDSRYSRPLRVKVRAANGKPLEGVSVTFTVGSSGGADGSGGSGGGSGASSAGASFAGGSAEATEMTNAAGIATSPLVTANSVAGKLTAAATTGGIANPVTFALENRAGKPASVTAGAAASESTPAGTRFPIRLAVTVADSDGNPVAGVRVRFSAPAGGPSGAFADGRGRTIEVKTDAAGVAVAPAFAANRTPGGYIVEATVGHARAAAFALVNEP